MRKGCSFSSIYYSIYFDWVIEQNLTEKKIQQMDHDFYVKLLLACF